MKHQKMREAAKESLSMVYEGTVTETICTVSVVKGVSSLALYHTLSCFLPSKNRLIASCIVSFDGFQFSVSPLTKCGNNMLSDA